MDEENNNLSPEEQKAETDALAEAKVDEIRSGLISDLGLTEEDNKDQLDKLVNREMDHLKSLSTAVRQKIDWRTKANGTTDDKGTDDKKAKSDDKPLTADEIRKTAEEGAMATFQKRDLDDMDHSDTIKDEIKAIADRQNISIRKAEKDSYIQHMIGEETKQREIDESADNGSNRSKGGIKIDTSKPLDASDFALHTEEGRAEWAEAKEAKREALKK